MSTVTEQYNFFLQEYKFQMCVVYTYAWQQELVPLSLYVYNAALGLLAGVEGGHLLLEVADLVTKEHLFLARVLQGGLGLEGGQVKGDGLPAHRAHHLQEGERNRIL